MQTRSRTVEMPSGLSLPLAFRMNTRLIGSGRYVSSLSASASSASHRSTPYASMSAKSWPSTPGAPLLERHWEEERHTSDETNGSINFLREIGLIVWTGDDEPRRIFLSQLASNYAAEWGRYWLMAREIKWADYGNEAGLAYDEALMRQFARESLPQLAKTIATDAAPIQFGPPGLDERNAIGRLGQLLYWCFGRLASAMLFDISPVYLKAVPSKGA